MLGWSWHERSGLFLSERGILVSLLSQGVQVRDYWQLRERGGDELFIASTSRACTLSSEQQ